MKGRSAPSRTWSPVRWPVCRRVTFRFVDQSGHLLTQSNTAGRDLNDAQLKYAADVEGRLQRRIEAILGPVVGSSNVHAQVTAQIDFSNKEQTEEQYAPNGDAFPRRVTLASDQ